LLLLLEDGTKFPDTNPDALLIDGKIVAVMVNIYVVTTELAPLLTALADPTRQRVVQILSEGPRRAGELAAASGTSAPTMSRHLRVLLKAGVVADERPAEDARTRVFWLRPEAIAPLREWLDALQAAGDEQLAAFKRHLEGRSGT
jgi:DNA-binding transcriptional ArsR family regulator